MATVLSAKQSTQGSPYAFYTLELTATNRTETTVKINYTITSWLQYSNSYLGYSLNAYITAGGTKSSAIALKGTETWSGTTKHTKTGSFTVKGLSATTTSITTYLEVDNVEGTGAALDKTKGKSLTIPAYASATVPSLSVSTATLGSTAVKITMDRDVSSWTHKLTYSLGSVSGTIGEDLATSYTWTPPLELAAGIPSAASGTMTITCKTYDSNGNSKGSKSVNLKVTVPQTADTLPTISSVTLEEATVTVEETFGFDALTFLQNVSAISANITAEGKMGATISGYAVIINGTKYTSGSFTSAVLTESGTMTVSITVTDSRGFTASQSEEITVIPYTPPTLSAINAKVTSTNAQVNIVGSVSAVNGQNTKSLKVNWKNVSTGETGEQTVGISEWEFDTTVTIAGLDSTASYEFTAVLTDALSTSQPMTATTGVIVLSRYAGGKGVTFGAEAESEGLVCHWDAEFLKELKVNGFDIAKTKLLWDCGSSPLWMTDTHTVTLSEAIAEQTHGIILAWSRYTNGAASNSYWNMHTFPKDVVRLMNGNGQSVWLTSTPRAGLMVGSKYVYIKDENGKGVITGYEGNGKDFSNTDAGINLTNTQFVLRYVFGF